MELAGPYGLALNQCQELLGAVVHAYSLADHIETIVSRDEGDSLREAAENAMGLDESIDLLIAATKPLSQFSTDVTSAIESLRTAPQRYYGQADLGGILSAPTYCHALVKVANRIIFEMRHPDGSISEKWIRWKLATVARNIKRIASVSNCDLLADEVPRELQSAATMDYFEYAHIDRDDEDGFAALDSAPGEIESSGISPDPTDDALVDQARDSYSGQLSDGLRHKEVAAILGLTPSAFSRLDDELKFRDNGQTGKKRRFDANAVIAYAREKRLTVSISFDPNGDH